MGSRKKATDKFANDLQAEADRVAEEIKARSAHDARLRRLTAEQLFANIRVAAASRGISTQSETVLAQEREAGVFEGLAIERIKYAGEIEAYNVQIGAYNTAREIRIRERNRRANLISSSLVQGFSVADSAFRASSASSARTTVQSNLTQPVGPRF